MGTLTKLFSSEVRTMKSQVEEMSGEEVIAAGQLRQGHKPSMAAMLTGTALIELARPRRSKSVPKGFVLAVTPSRVLAYSCTGVADDEDGENYRVVVRGKQQGSWPREGVSFASLPGKESHGTLDLCGEKVEVWRPSTVDDEETDALLEMLAS
jgi:hypothetical protein